MSDLLTRRCGFCESKVSPVEVQRLLGIPFVHRYRCACTARFDIMTGFGQAVLLLLNAFVVGSVLVLPRERFASSSDRTGILLFLLGLQVPIVALVLVRTRKRDRFHVRL